MLARIQAQLPHLSQAERRVGDWILANPRAVLDQDTRSIARQVSVSQPTLVRFARSLGCSGFQDLRLKLAQSLGSQHGSTPASMASIAASPDTNALCERLFDFTLDALGQVRDGLDRELLTGAIRMLDEARRVTFFGFGNAITVAHEAMRHFLRTEMQVSACTDAPLQSLVSAQMHEGDVLVLLSQSGRSPELLQTVAAVHAAGATTLALTASGSPLQQAATLALCIDVADGGDALTPGTAQLAQLMVVDLLAIGVAARRSQRIVKRVERAALKNQRG